MIHFAARSAPARKISHSLRDRARRSLGPSALGHTPVKMNCISFSIFTPLSDLGDFGCATRRILFRFVMRFNDLSIEVRPSTRQFASARKAH
jgi:hypothetical protein